MTSPMKLPYLGNTFCGKNRVERIAIYEREREREREKKNQFWTLDPTCVLTKWSACSGLTICVCAIMYVMFVHVTFHFQLYELERQQSREDGVILALPSVCILACSFTGWSKTKNALFQMKSLRNGKFIEILVTYII